MIINRKNWLIGATAAAAIATSALSWSMGPRGGGDHDPGRMLARISDRLDLSAEQKASVDELLNSARQASAADRKRLDDLREELVEMRTNFDAAKAKPIADEIGQITGRMVFEASKTWSGVYQLLDDEQRQQLEKLMEEREARRDKWQRGGKPPQ